MVQLRWRRSRYAAPAVVLAVIGAGALVPTLGAASSLPALPALSAGQLLADVAKAGVPELSGALTWSANLGLSDLSSMESELGGQGGGGGAGRATSGFDPLSLLSGSYQIDVWLDGATAEHLALIDAPAQEVDLVRNGDQAWLWDSQDQTVTHFIGSASAPAPRSASPATALPSPPPQVTAVALTPQELAAQVLSRLSPTTSVTVGSPTYVAGQAAYQLVVAPKAAPGSTVRSIEIDLGATGPLLGVALEVAVYATSQSSPAFQLGFTGVVHLGMPPASELSFTPPPGSTVVTREGGGTGTGEPGWQAMFSGLGLQGVGTGWTRVVTGTDSALAGAGAQSELSSLSSAVDVGGAHARLLSTDLLNVLVLPSGRFYAGFVTPRVLEAVASSGS